MSDSNETNDTIEFTSFGNFKKKADEFKTQQDDQQTKLDKLIFDMEQIKLEKKKLEEASLISDMFYYLYKQFILLHQDDDDVRKFVTTTKTSTKIDVDEFHDFLQERDDDSSKNIKSKFNEAINKNSVAKVFTFDSNLIRYSTICQPHSSIRLLFISLNPVYSIQDLSKYDSIKEYLKYLKIIVQNMTIYKNDGEIVYKQFQSLHNVILTLLIWFLIYFILSTLFERMMMMIKKMI